MMENNLHYAYCVRYELNSSCEESFKDRQNNFNKLCESNNWNILYQDNDSGDKFYLGLLLRRIEPCSTLSIPSIYVLGCTPREIVDVLKQLYQLHIWLFIGSECADIDYMIESIEDHCSYIMDEEIQKNDEFFREMNDEFCIL